MTARTAALILGLVFLAVGAAGLFPNPLVGPAGIFATNSMHDYVHLASGALLVLAGAMAMAPTGLVIVGLLYGVATVLGFAMPGDMLFGVIHLNDADRYLHAGLAVILLIAGFLLPQSKEAAQNP